MKSLYCPYCHQPLVPSIDQPTILWHCLTPSCFFIRQPLQIRHLKNQRIEYSFVQPLDADTN